jgi:hypothetical protein
MSSYRLYFVNDQGHIARAQAFEAASDEAALAFAEEIAFGERAELWDRGRMVAQLEAERRTA